MSNKSTRVSTLHVAALTQVQRWPQGRTGRTYQGWCLDCERQFTSQGRGGCPLCGSASWQPVQGVPLAAWAGGRS